MDIKNQFKHQWKAYFKRGGGMAIVYGSNEAEAKHAALAAYRKTRTMVDLLPLDEVVESVDYLGEGDK